mgnify:CR=1 FL=1
MTEGTPIPRDGFVRARRVLALDGGKSDALWWNEGRVVAVGQAAMLDRAAPRGVPRYQFPDAVITPGFVDGHTHFAMWALGRRRVQRRRRAAKGRRWK